MPIRIFRSKPIEREYEGWLMCAIDAEMAKLGVRADTWAVHPHEESTYPADEKFLADGKLISFQVKRANCRCRGYLPSRAHSSCKIGDLHWSLGSPAGQFAKVVARPEIYYVLPEFLNRSLRTAVLDHTWFWRPKHASTAGKIWASLGRNRKRSRRESGTSFRWPALMRQFGTCEIGLQVQEGQSIRSALSFRQAVGEGIPGRSASALICLFVPGNHLDQIKAGFR